jgi:hypothetical protein
MGKGIHLKIVRFFVRLMYVRARLRLNRFFLALLYMYVSVLFLAFKLFNEICNLVFAFLGLPSLGGKPCLGLLFLETI